MKITKFTILLMLVSVILVGSLQSQVKTKTTSYWKKPAGFIIEWNFSYSQPLPNMMGDMGEQFSFKNYGVKTGFGSQIYFKLVTDKKGRIRPYMTLGYDLFLNTDDNNVYIPANVLTEWPSDPSVGTASGKSKMYLHNFSAAVGFEYAFFNKTRWTPYTNFDFGLNMIFGTYKQTPNSTGQEVSLPDKNARRLGLGLGAGVQGRLTKNFGVSFGVKYKLPNLLLKDSKKSTEVNKMYINDKEDVALSPNLSKDRNMMYLQIYVGATFFIGKK